MNREEMKKRDSEPKMVRFYGIAELGAKLNEKQPFFWTTDSAMYAIELRERLVKNEETGKMEMKNVPTNFRRVDKNRQLKGKARIAARKLDNKLYKAQSKEQEKMRNDIGQGFLAAATGLAEPGAQISQA